MAARVAFEGIVVVRYNITNIHKSQCSHVCILTHFATTFLWTTVVSMCVSGSSRKGTGYVGEHRHDRSVRTVLFWCRNYFCYSLPPRHKDAPFTSRNSVAGLHLNSFSRKFPNLVSEVLCKSYSISRHKFAYIKLSTSEHFRRGKSALVQRSISIDPAIPERGIIREESEIIRRPDFPGEGNRDHEFSDLSVL